MSDFTDRIKWSKFSIMQCRARGIKTANEMQLVMENRQLLDQVNSLTSMMATLGSDLRVMREHRDFYYEEMVRLQKETGIK